MQNKVVVSNSSPLMNLAIIGQLSLLKEIFNEIIIPEEVWYELVIDGKNKPGSEEIENATWIKKVTAKNKELVKLLDKDLDTGEAAAIAIAIEMNADIVLLDETDARNIAEIYKIQKTGVIGILLRAKKYKLITDIKPLLDKLKDDANFWIKQELYDTILSK